ncbi:hypothetical protein BDD12DRAFT_113508 [Trichophaea hybrida]|nr:hypothetical protein BDD12DRAFT_113508 [Trichophaea hybrida]
MVCLITTFKSLPLREKFPSHHQRSIRLQHLPLAPADPHPDTNEILSTEWTGTPSVTSRPSYVKLNSILVVPSRLLTPLNGGTAKLSIEALAEVTKKILGDEDLLEDMSNDWRTSLRCVKRAMSAPPLRPAMVVRKAKGPKNLCGKNFWAPLTETCL